MTVKDDGPMYDGLLADGTLKSWGIAIPINHRLDDTSNYMLWATMSDWSDVGKLQQGFEGLFATRTPEQMAELNKAYKEATVEGAHHDVILRQEIYRQGSGEQRPQYLHIGYYLAKPGMDDRLTAFYKKAVQPAYEKLLADGVITGFGLGTQALHGEKGWSHAGWFTVADLGAIDTVQSALQANIKEEDYVEVVPIMVPEAHWDVVMFLVHLGGMPQK